VDVVVGMAGNDDLPPVSPELLQKVTILHVRELAGGLHDENGKSMIGTEMLQPRDYCVANDGTGS
jgi:hypothetical protein